jgi:hypothetical protein
MASFVFSSALNRLGRGQLDLRNLRAKYTLGVVESDEPTQKEFVSEYPTSTAFTSVVLDDNFFVVDGYIHMPTLPTETPVFGIIFYEPTTDRPVAYYDFGALEMALEARDYDISGPLFTLVTYIDGVYQ